MKKDSKIITFKIKRWDPGKGDWRISTYTVTIRKGMTILDALVHIKETIDHTLSYRASCRMGICGSCGMTINGKPRLACETQILELRSNTISIEPLKNFDLIKDLATDFSLFFEKQTKIRPYLIRSDEDEYWNPSREYKQTPTERLLYEQFSNCITCGLCYAACPTNATNINYLGPQALMNTYRFIADSRDEGTLERIELVDAVDGIWGCHLSGACSDVCPKGVDPALAIQLLRGLVAAKALRRIKHKKATGVVPPSEAKRRKGIPEPPPFNV
jgi:succinate dehydrogenase / fumarate reductase iron-sulfur subunit